MADTTGALSEVKVANMAATTLDEEHLTSLDDDTALGRFMAANFGPCRDEVNRLHPWVFAKTRAEVAKLADAPTFDWLYQYQLPTTCIRPLPLRCEGRWNAPIVPHEREGRLILCNEQSPIKLVYIKRITNMSEWEPLAARVLADYLALKGAQRMTGKESYVVKARQLLAQSLEDAKHVNGLDWGTPEYDEESDVHSVRLLG